MIRITAFLLAFTLTSFPAAAAVCVGWCGARPATTGHCHEEDSQALANAQGTCSVSIEPGPFVREEFGVAPLNTTAATPDSEVRFALHVPWTAVVIRADRRLMAVVESPPFVLRL